MTQMNLIKNKLKLTIMMGSYLKKANLRMEKFF